MISDPNIEVALNSSYDKIKNFVKPKKATIYTGPPDTFLILNTENLNGDH